MLSDDTVTDGSTFLVTDPDGRTSRDHDGLYHADTRHLETYDLTLGERTLESINVYTPRPGQRVVSLSTPLEAGARTLSVTRRQALQDGLHERIEIENLSNNAVTDTLFFSVGTRFLDLFEVRGEQQIDREIDATAQESGISFTYRPSDIDFSRETHVTVAGASAPRVSVESSTSASIEVDLELAPNEQRTVYLSVGAESETANPADAYESATTTHRERTERWKSTVDVPESPDRTIQNVLDQSVEDLLSLRIETDHGPVLAAGTPWFATVFGRDSLLAAYQILPSTASPAKGTLRYLAAHQATERDGFRDAAPGKIFHEIRHGELSVREIVPHTPYYGTIDATALWVVLLHETYRQTGDEDLVRDLWENLEAAIEWLERDGDADGDGFLEYGGGDRDDGGLRHQAWKDSDDGIVHPDGSHPEGPIAPAEVQGYYYDALRRAADLQEEFGDSAESKRLRDRADELQTAFDEQFWLPDESFYAVALDGNNEPVESVTTNPGHGLWSGIVPEARADVVIDRLVAEDMFTGWGIRTLSADHEAYNPQSYHLGSVWPHDNSLVVLGMVEYGRVEAASAVVEGLLEAAIERGNDRLPELFAGFERTATAVPIEYGVACEPQAWAAGAPLAGWLALAEDDAAQEVHARTV